MDVRVSVLASETQGVDALSGHDCLHGQADPANESLKAEVGVELDWASPFHRHPAILADGSELGHAEAP